MEILLFETIPRCAFLEIHLYVLLMKSSVEQLILISTRLVSNNNKYDLSKIIWQTDGFYKELLIEQKPDDSLEQFIWCNICGDLDCFVLHLLIKLSET